LFGRPDMAPMIFTRAILADEEIRVFNRGDMWRDFTYIDDIVSGVLASLEKPPANDPPHRLYNLGNHQSENLMDFIAALEGALGKKAKLRLEPMQQPVRAALRSACRPAPGPCCGPCPGRCRACARPAPDRAG
ncbi:MAG TPA: NAD-dependent epimerase/dehydratase family protein, partial [Spirillospora sp.]|nr:NAD-dependent epimerase/dehydratase family protein [Spirillospora sp.]